MKTFDDLEFAPQRICSQSKQAVLDLGNDLSISVVYGPGKYSDEDDGTYEVAIFHENEFVPLQAYDDVIGWQSPEEITALMEEAQESDMFVQKKINAKEKYREEMDL